MAYKSKADQAEAARKHYALNTGIIKRRAASFNKVARNRNRDFLNNYLSKNPCVDCGFSDIRALEFDHVRGGKIRDVTRMVANASSLDRIRSEILKCEVRCANCHRIKTHETVWAEQKGRNNRFVTSRKRSVQLGFDSFSTAHRPDIFCAVFIFLTSAEWALVFHRLGTGRWF